MLGRVISHYTIEERLGGGGMGVVYKARDTRLERYVALKFLSPDLDRDQNAKKRFVQEAKAASALDHPNICTIYDIGETDEGYLYIAMAYYEGETLKKKLFGMPLAQPWVADIAGQVAAGLSKAHELRIIHRDIKPPNLMITKDRAIKILDFGLAKLVGQSDLTHSGCAVGTAAYMSPEQAQGLEVDERTDIWSWGVILYEMLTGRLPFRGENHLQLFHSIVKEQPISVSAVRNDLAPGFDYVVSRALQKDPAMRFASIREAAQELQRILVVSDNSHAMTESRVVYVDPKAAPSGKVEKKQVAVLKSLIVGYADLLEHVSSEELQPFWKGVEDELNQIASTLHGVINDFSGDEFTVLFGIPTAEEDDHIRAVRAALAIHDCIRRAASRYEGRIGKPIAAQSGIAAGLVVMNPAHSANRKYELAGHAMQTALALAAHAEAGEVWISEEGRRWLEDSFEMESRDEIPVKGRARKLKPYRIAAESVQSRFDLWQKEQLTAYTGRKKELGILQDELEAACRGEGQFVAVIGESGVGKSRLLYEFRRTLDLRPLRILQGGCHVYSSKAGYSPFIETLKNEWKLRDQENLEEAAIEQISLLDPSLMEFIPVYLHLLAIPTSKHPLPRHLQGKELQLAISEALCAFVLGNKDRPVLLLLEDWHAADDASRSILGHLQEMIPGHPILVVATCRPECSFRAAAHHTTIYVNPLDPTSSRTVIQSALGVESVPEKLVGLVIERTGGNPFFIEEICQALREDGTVKIEGHAAILMQSPDKLRLPETIQSVIGSRLDRIEPEARGVLEIASIVGREFNRSLLQKLIPNEARLLQSLEHLKGLGLIQQLRVLPEASYKFKHPLVQETAYEGLLAHERKVLHGSVGEAIEELCAGRLEEYFDVLAHHFHMAENWDKAVRYGRESARKAVSIGHFADALRRLEQVEDWIARLPQNAQTEHVRTDVLLEQERLCETLGIRDRQEEILHRVLSILREMNHRPSLMEVHRRRGELYTLIGRSEEGEKALDQSLQLSLELGDPSGERSAHRSKGFLHWHQGRSDEAVASNERAIAIDRGRNDAEGLATDLMNLSAVLRGMGNNQRALECAVEALRIYETVDDPVKRATAFHIVGNIYRELGDDDQALYYFQQSMDISSRYRLVVIQPFHLAAIASIYRQQGKIEDSLKLLRQSVDLCRKSGYADGLARSLHVIGEFLHSWGRSDEAVGSLEEAGLLYSKLMDRTNAALMFNTVASIHERANRIADAISAWSRVKDLRMQMNDAEGLLAALQALGRLSRQLEDYSSAVRFYSEALEVSDRKEAKATLRSTLGILEWKRANHEAALNHFRVACGIFQDSGDLVHTGLMLNSIAVTLKDLGQREEAVATLQEAVDLNRKTNQRLLEGHSLSILGDVCYESGQLEEAAGCFRASLAIRKEVRDRRGEGWMLYQLARVYASLKSEPLARQSFDAAAHIAGECGDQDLIRACENFQSNFKPN